MLLTLGILLVGLVAAFSAEAALPADTFYQSSPPLRLDSVWFKAQEAALPLLRNGCQEVLVVALPDGESEVQVYAACTEWQEVRPASQ